MSDTTTTIITSSSSTGVAVDATERVITATDVDVPAVAGTLAAAFHDDPVFAWCFPDGDRRGRILPRFFALVAASTVDGGEVELTDDGAAAAIWVPPGAPAPDEDEARALEAATADAIGGPGDELDRTFAVMELLEQHHPAEEHRYLWFVGARPERQGEGLGSRLLDSMLRRCDRDGTPAYLEATSDDNRRLYERHGFAVVERLSVDGCPPLHAMWRDPR